MHVTIIAGARPNFMKIAPIIDAIKNNSTIRFRLVHTGQHYDDKLSGSFFEELNIPNPDINLGVGSGSHAEQTAKIMTAFEQELLHYPTDYVLLVGDVNSTLACAIVAKKMHTKVIHVEAGLRSGDLDMPEEINRMVVDAITDIFFTTTEDASTQLVREGHDSSAIHFVGNVMIDSIVRNHMRLRRPDFLIEDTYFLLTLHRPSNVDDPEILHEYLQTISKAVRDQAKVYFPIHPRTRNVLRIDDLPKEIIVCDPLPYLEFMYMVKTAAGVITDSGGIQEETTYLRVPCLTLRENTERPETIEFGTNELIGRDLNKLKNSIERVLSDEWKKGTLPAKWDGQSANRIVEIIKQLG